MSQHSWPTLEYSSWKESQATLHQWLQIVGKIRLKTMPWQNHSWHTTLYISPVGFTTQSIPYAGGAFEIVFNFESHRLDVISTHADTKTMDLYPRSVADFYKKLFQLLSEIGLDVSIHGKPNELEEAIPFHENEENCHYDGNAVKIFWEVMVKINCVFNEFRSKYIGKCSPIHLFWGALDLAVTRFSGREAPLHPGGAPNMPLEVMQEAYSHEVSSAGFWPGGDSFPEPLFYSYCYPTPDAFSKQTIKPKAAFFNEDLGEFVLLYKDLISAKNPDQMLMDFLETTYVAAAETGDWDRKALERP